MTESVEKVALRRALSSALRFAASRSAITATDEKAILAAFDAQAALSAIPAEGENERWAMAQVLRRSVITFGGVVQTDIGDRAADALTAAHARIAELESRGDALAGAVKRLRDGYADAAAGLAYVREHHGKLYGVGFDRVADHFFEWVTMPEREGLMAGSHQLPAPPHGSRADE